MSNRIDRGWKLYLADAVEVDFISEDQMHFNVVSSSRKEIHQVAMLDDTWNCSCEDFHNRNDREATKQLICMHIHAASFKLAEINGMEVLKHIKDMMRLLNSPALTAHLEKLDNADNILFNTLKQLEKGRLS